MQHESASPCVSALLYIGQIERDKIMRKNENREIIIALINQGLTRVEIMDAIGAKTDSFICKVAKENGIKLTKPADVKARQIAEMRASGFEVKDIADTLGMSNGGVQDIIKRYSIPHTPKQFTVVCAECGAVFYTQHRQKLYCDTKCAKKHRSRQPEKADDSFVADALKRYKGDEWEYVGGYTGSDGSVDIRHKLCGTVTTRSWITIRHSKGITCEVCEDLARKEREEKERKQKEWEREAKRLSKPVPNFRQTEMKQCRVCSAFFVGRGTVCSSGCAKKIANRYSTLKKQQRTVRAWTEESKTITLSKLYDRDEGTCWICGGRCDKDADPNSNYYPSIDHVFPIALGGKDEWSNIKLAHRICNSLKGAKIIESDFPTGVADLRTTAGPTG